MIRLVGNFGRLQKEIRVTCLVIAVLIIGLLMSPTVEASQAQKMKPEFSLQGISVGMTEQDVLTILGKPARQDASEYGFEWFIYNQDYQHYLQVGVDKGKVVALYTNASDWSSASGIGFGSTRSAVEKAYGSAMSQIKKGNTVYSYQDGAKESGIYLVDGVYATIFYDLHKKNTVTAVQLIKQETELAFQAFYGKPSERLRESFEHQIFDLANAVRVREGQAPFSWNDYVATSARQHSVDMMSKNYFDHQSLDGKSPFERIKAQGISYKKAGENIAAGQVSAIFAHEGWMNSIGHRENILGEYQRLGVGISFGGNYTTYYTQNFYTPIQEG